MTLGRRNRCITRRQALGESKRLRKALQPMMVCSIHTRFCILTVTRQHIVSFPRGKLSLTINADMKASRDVQLLACAIIAYQTLTQLSSIIPTGLPQKHWRALWRLSCWLSASATHDRPGRPTAMPSRALPKLAFRWLISTHYISCAPSPYQLPTLPTTIWN